MDSIYYILIGILVIICFLLLRFFLIGFAESIIDTIKRRAFQNISEVDMWIKKEEFNRIIERLEGIEGRLNTIELALDEFKKTVMPVYDTEPKKFVSLDSRLAREEQANLEPINVNIG